MNINSQLYMNIYDLYKPTSNCTFTIPYRIKLKLIFGKTWLGKTKSKDILEEYFQRPQKLKIGLDKKWSRIQCLYFQGFLQTVRLLKSRCWVLPQKTAMFGQQPWEDEKQLIPTWPLKKQCCRPPAPPPTTCSSMNQQSCWKPFNEWLATLAVFQPAPFEVRTSERNLETTLSTAWLLVQGQAGQETDRDKERETDRAPARPFKEAGQSQGAT